MLYLLKVNKLQAFKINLKIVSQIYHSRMLK